MSADEEDAGLDISEHGMYGYPEQFIPNEEYPGGGAGYGPAPAMRPEPAPVDADDRRQPVTGVERR